MSEPNSTGEGKGLSADLRLNVAKAIHHKNDLCCREGAEESWDSGYECICFELADAALAILTADSALRLKLAKLVAKWRKGYGMNNYGFHVFSTNCISDIETLLTEESSQVGTKEGQ